MEECLHRKSDLSRLYFQHVVCTTISILLIGFLVLIFPESKGLRLVLAEPILYLGSTWLALATAGFPIFLLIVAFFTSGFGSGKANKSLYYEAPNSFSEVGVITQSLYEQLITNKDIDCIFAAPENNMFVFSLKSHNNYLISISVAKFCLKITIKINNISINILGTEKEFIDIKTSIDRLIQATLQDLLLDLNIEKKQITNPAKVNTSKYHQQNKQ